jgi:ankyrin repeat protein
MAENPFLGNFEPINERLFLNTDVEDLKNICQITKGMKKICSFFYLWKQYIEKNLNTSMIEKSFNSVSLLTNAIYDAPLSQKDKENLYHLIYNQLVNYLKRTTKIISEHKDYYLFLLEHLSGVSDKKTKSKPKGIIIARDTSPSSRISVSKALEDLIRENIKHSEYGLLDMFLTIFNHTPTTNSLTEAIFWGRDSELEEFECKNKYKKIIEIFLNHGADFKLNDDIDNIYRIAIGKEYFNLGSKNKILFLFKLGAPINYRWNSDGDYIETVLISSIHRDDFDLVKFLVENGADVNFPTETGITPLMAAALDGNEEIVRYLISEGADPNLQSEHGFTALMFSALHPKIYSILVKISDISLKNGCKHTASDFFKDKSLLISDDTFDNEGFCSDIGYGQCEEYGAEDEEE